MVRQFRNRILFSIQGLDSTETGYEGAGSGWTVERWVIKEQVGVRQ